MKVKICGITDRETALEAVKAGADAIGFVFAESKRKISPMNAKEITLMLPSDVMKVGVFVNEEKEVIEATVDEAGLNMIQLHGDESPEFCNGFSVPVIKALSIENREGLRKLNDFPCDYILLDSPKGKYRGGNGIKFDWRIAEGIQSEKKIILAGGLTPDNVCTAIRIVQPFMVDVSSGVETDGKKDLKKIAAFIENAKGVRIS
ncbi:phosphoribosylanthranilate isomerase [Bacillus methanolicus]|uniref:N-(5'-phosphoribosyl)anthranilate isomerase n=1 Tax=Bacillus methanolicus (strain MGA3 / ATCC 53907) TaxID=796606 RepID=I3E994_BACMM|nr:phosphoribosylanthranilate isomerase [Bacillus methanolicus]AIE60319.1 N-(5'-phosphoribosyl)anthranilate isomerase [Bacillus methanolicus MGA3]EIJ83065.1 Phosphoribosylanthranilate isomerase [Bacillus methanolicus MGA3]